MKFIFEENKQIIKIFASNFPYNCIFWKWSRNIGWFFTFVGYHLAYPQHAQQQANLFNLRVALSDISILYAIPIPHTSHQLVITETVLISNDF